jgi:GDPmannose 4,6-dehydratase
LKRAFITGVTGQDGAYLCQLLLSKGYEVFGLTRRKSPSEAMRWLGIEKDVQFLIGDVADLSSLIRHLRTIAPDEIYNFAAQSSVRSSWDHPLVTGQVTALGVANVLEAIRLEVPHTRFYQSSSSEMFGLAEGTMHNEETRFYPRSPYAAAKAYGHWLTVNYRESHRLHASCGILFNHESPVRGMEFVSRKVSDGVARIKLGMQDELVLGNLEARRDWGHARDYVGAMWSMLQQDEPDDYVIATGRATSVYDMCRIAFSSVGLDVDQYVRTDSALLRPADVHVLVGDYSKAKRKLGWSPTVTLEETIAEMVESDIKRLRGDPRHARAE